MDDVQNAGIKDRQEAHNHSVLSARGALFRIYLCTKIFGELLNQLSIHPYVIQRTKWVEKMWNWTGDNMMFPVT